MWGVHRSVFTIGVWVSCKWPSRSPVSTVSSPCMGGRGGRGRKGGASRGWISGGKCRSEVPRVEGAALPGAELAVLCEIHQSATFEVEQTQRKRPGSTTITKLQSTMCARLAIPVGKCKSAVPKVEGAALLRGGIARSRQDLAIRSLRSGASTARFLFRKGASDYPRPGSALKDKRTLTVGGGKNPGLDASLAVPGGPNRAPRRC